MTDNQFKNSAQFAYHAYRHTEKHIELFINYIQACTKPFFSANTHHLALILPALNLLNAANNFYTIGQGIMITAKELFQESTRFKLDIIMDGLVGILFNLINICLNIMNILVSFLTVVCRSLATLFNGGYAESQTSRAILRANSFFQFAKEVVRSPANMVSADNIRQLDDSLLVDTIAFLRRDPIFSP